MLLATRETIIKPHNTKDVGKFYRNQRKSGKKGRTSHTNMQNIIVCHFDQTYFFSKLNQSVAFGMVSMCTKFDVPESNSLICILLIDAMILNFDLWSKPLISWLPYTAYKGSLLQHYMYYNDLWPLKIIGIFFLSKWFNAQKIPISSNNSVYIQPTRFPY
jgi:hypothetical protein